MGPLARAFTRRLPAVVATLVMAIFAMEASFLAEGWSGGSYTRWYTPPDLWRLNHVSNQLGHGHLGGIYVRSGLIGFPGFEYLLAPVAVLGHALNLTTIPAPFFAEPTDWWLLGPFSLLIAATVLFAADAAAERLGVSRPRRWLLSFVEAALLGHLVVWWGHPEDALCVMFVICAALAADSKRCLACSWLLGLALAMQPLALVALPAVIARSSRREFMKMVPGLLLPVVVVLLPSLAASWHQTTNVLFHQPAYPTLDHRSPWTQFAPHLAHGAVSGGPSRTIATLVAAVIGFGLCRRYSGLSIVLWACALAFGIRMAGESVVVGYYPWPTAALCVVVAAALAPRRLAAATLLAIGLTLVADQSSRSTAAWWLPVMALTVSLLLVSWPGPLRSAADEDGALVTVQTGAPSESPTG